MTIIDISVIVIVLLSALIGLVRGLTKEVLSMASWIGAVVSTLLFWPLVQHIARQYIENPMMADGATILALFILFLILFSLISYFLSNLVRQSALGGIDRSLGMLFGVLRGATVICLMEMFVSCFVSRIHHPDLLKTSKFSTFIYRGSDGLFQILPGSLQGYIKQQQIKYADGGVDTAKAVQDKAIKAILEPAIQQSMEEIAKLKPKEQKQDEDETAYSKKQRLDMERLLQQEEVEN